MTEVEIHSLRILMETEVEELSGPIPYISIELYREEKDYSSVFFQKCMARTNDKKVKSITFKRRRFGF